MRILAVLLAVAALLAGLYGIYGWGRSDGNAACIAAQAKAADVGRAKQKVKTRADIKRGVATGAVHEQNRAALDAFFDQLTQEQADAPPDPVDSCVLPPDRLRRWNAANAGGPDQDGTAAQPHRAASAAATGTDGQGAGPGDQSPGSGEGVPPPRLADVPAAGVRGDQP
jgi:hypothetical protein